jgi:transposase
LRRLFKFIIEFTIDELSKGEPPKNSENSSMPPSSDIGGKENDSKVSEDEEKRKKGKEKRKQGAQEGHEGKTLLRVPNPDETIYLNKEREKYAKDPDWEIIKSEERQVLDVKLERKVTAFVKETYRNKLTGAVVVSMDFPPWVKAAAQYGPELKVIVVALRNHGKMSVERIADILSEAFDMSISTGTIANIINEVESSPILDRFEEAGKEALLASPYINADETSVSVKGKKWWVHVYTASRWVLFFLHPNRGKKAMDDIGIIGRFFGVLVHDFWAAYYMFVNLRHAVCNAHILRELKLAIEMKQKTWPNRLVKLLLYANKLKKENGGIVPKKFQKIIRKEYRRIVEGAIKAIKENEIVRPPGKIPKRGRIAKPKYLNLLERLLKFEDEVLRFMTDKNVPFTNNDAERPIRMIKVHMKVSGCYRSENSARISLRMGGYLVTCKNHKINRFKAIKMLIKNEEPWFITEVLEPAKINDLKKAA